MRTYTVTVRDDDLPRLKAVAHQLWEKGYLGVSLATDSFSMTFDDDAYDEMEYLGKGVDGYADRRRMTIGNQLYEIRQVA